MLADNRKVRARSTKCATTPPPHRAAPPPRTPTSQRCVLGICAVALLASCVGSQPPIGALTEMPQHLVSQSTEKSLPYHHTFKYTGTEQTFKVPAGVTSITVVARGAAGAGVGEYGNLSGFGGRVYAVIPVSPRERLHIYVGGAGVNYWPPRIRRLQWWW